MRDTYYISNFFSNIKEKFNSMGNIISKSVVNPPLYITDYQYLESSIDKEKDNIGSVVINNIESNIEKIVKCYYDEMEKYYYNNNEEYELLKYIVELGFINFKRVNLYYEHKKRIDGYIKYKNIMDLNKELINYTILDEYIISKLKENYNFFLTNRDEYIGDIPNDSILNIKKSLDKLKEYIPFPDMYNMYYSHSSKNFTEILVGNIFHKDILDNKDKFEGDVNNIITVSGTTRYKISYKDIIVFHNNDYVSLLYPIKGLYIVIDSWGCVEADGMSFKDFILQNKIEK